MILPLPKSTAFGTNVMRETNQAALTGQPLLDDGAKGVFGCLLH